jgi:hypothetical protein
MSSKSVPDTDSDEDFGKRKFSTVQPSNTINELLMKALEEAAKPGVGDEDPEILPAPAHTSSGVAAEEEDAPEAKIRRNEQEEKNKAIEEEERRVAEMNFDYDALLPSSSLRERAKYIPLRLSYEERKDLRLVNAAINVADYTNTVDVVFQNKARRQHTQLQYIVAFLTGLIAATSFATGQEVLANRNFSLYQELIQRLLEIARRYKIENPEKMRSEYGKLVILYA